MIKRMWKSLLTSSDLPREIRESPEYMDRDYWIDRAKVTDDWRYIGIWFDDKTHDLWENIKGKWIRVRHSGIKLSFDAALEILANVMFDDYCETAKEMNEDSNQEGEPVNADSLFEADCDDNCTWDEITKKLMTILEKRFSKE